MENWKNYHQGLLVTETMTRNLITEWTKIIMILIKSGMKDAENEEPLRQAYKIKYDLWVQNLGKDFPTRKECSGWCNGIPEKYTGGVIHRRGKLKSKTPKGIVPIEAFRLSLDFRSWNAQPDEKQIGIEAGFSSKENIYKNAEDPDMEEIRPENNFLYVDLNINTNYIKTKGDLLRRLPLVREELREALAHEFQHARDTRIMGTLITVEKDAKYYFAPREIKGHARGYYERARITKTTFEEILDERIEMIKARSERQVIHLLKKASGAEDPKDAEKYMQRVDSKRDLIERLPEWKKAILKYARGNLPCAKLKNGDPVHPQGCEERTKTQVPDTVEPDGSGGRGLFDRFKDWWGNSEGEKFGGGGASGSW